MRASQLIDVAAIPTALINTAFPTAVNVTVAVKREASLKLVLISKPTSVAATPLDFAAANTLQEATSPVELFRAVTIPSKVAPAVTAPKVKETIVVGVAFAVVTCPVALLVSVWVTVEPLAELLIPSSLFCAVWEVKKLMLLAAGTALPVSAVNVVGTEGVPPTPTIVI
jgi:hypothetical protein